jgi:hypothetical protein
MGINPAQTRGGPNIWALIWPNDLGRYLHTVGSPNVRATVNQHTPLHHEGWMDGKWSENSFLLGFSSLANHGG